MESSDMTLQGGRIQATKQNYLIHSLHVPYHPYLQQVVRFPVLNQVWIEHSISYAAT